MAVCVGREGVKLLVYFLQAVVIIARFPPSFISSHYHHLHRRQKLLFLLPSNNDLEKYAGMTCNLATKLFVVS